MTTEEQGEYITARPAELQDKIHFTYYPILRNGQVWNCLHTEIIFLPEGMSAQDAAALYLEMKYGKGNVTEVTIDMRGIPAPGRAWVAEQDETGATSKDEDGG
jgi:hypothetical protein